MMRADRDNPDEPLQPDRPGDSFLALLIKDVIAAEARLADEDDQGNRRDYVRTAFAAIEGSVWLCREHVRGVAQTMRELTPLADLALRERTYSVTEQGELIEQIRFVTLPAMIRLIVKQARLVSPGVSVDFGGSGWSKLKQAIDIRNRATHPKSIEDLHISLDDLQSIRSGFYWTLTTNADVMAAVNATLSTYSDNMRVLLEALKAEDPRALQAYRWSLLHMEDEP